MIDLHSPDGTGYTPITGFSLNGLVMRRRACRPFKSQQLASISMAYININLISLHVPIASKSYSQRNQPSSSQS